MFLPIDAVLTFVLFFDQVTDDFVVEVLYRLPLDSLLQVFFLFGLKSQLNEQLLQFFVAKIDAKLFEPADETSRLVK